MTDTQQPRGAVPVGPQAASDAASGVLEPQGSPDASGGRSAAPALREVLDLFARHSCDGITLGYTLTGAIPAGDFERWSRAAEGADGELERARAERDQLSLDCDARDETIRHLDAGLTHERGQVARLEAELVAARSTVDRVRGLVDECDARGVSSGYPLTVTALRDAMQPQEPAADETPAEAARQDRAYWDHRYDRGGEAS